MPEDQFRPDGAVVDAEGNIWIAHYGHFKITCHAADGRLLHQIDTTAAAMTCPAFGGADGTTLYATSAAQAVPDGQLHTQPNAGRVFVVETGIKGQKEHQVIL
jgi:sugar lactone lactonase YvrE